MSREAGLTRSTLYWRHYACGTSDNYSLINFLFFLDILYLLAVRLSQDLNKEAWNLCILHEAIPSDSVMFKFQFDIDDIEEDEELLQLNANPGDTTSQPYISHAQRENDKEEINLEPCREASIVKLVEQLPPKISYSPLIVDVPGIRGAGGTDSEKVVIPRRDLFDARFQLIANPENDEEGDERDGHQNNSHQEDPLRFLETPSDLVPGVYEGGLKTWECSVDLVEYLETLDRSGDPSGREQTRGWRQILEIGCGTAIPTCNVLRKIFSGIPGVTGDVDHSTPAPSVGAKVPKYQVHLQDYNLSVLQLVTLPNVLLTWYFSPASSAYRSSFSDEQDIPTMAATVIPDGTHSHIHSSSAERSTTELIPDPYQPSELNITPSLKTYFLTWLDDHSIQIKFFSGSWDWDWSIHTSNEANDSDGEGTERGKLRYDLVLTSETIYRPASLRSLAKLLRGACGYRDSGRVNDYDRELKDLTDRKLVIGNNGAGLSPNGLRVEKNHDTGYLCLVAAKVVYFGVGGGIPDFVKMVEGGDQEVGRGTVKVVWEKTVGVGRNILSVVWNE